MFELLNISTSLVHTISFILGFSIITVFHTVLGELVPKSLAITSAEKIAMKTALPLIMFYKVSYPIMWVFNHSTNLILKAFGISQTDEHDEAHTDQEIKLLVAQSYEQGLVDEAELFLVDNIFDFTETKVKDIMIPRTDMKCIFIEDIIRDVRFVPESMSISDLLKLFKKGEAQIAIIIENIDTIGGWIYSQAKTYPQVNDKFFYDNYEFIVLKCDQKRINRIPIKRISEK